MDKTEALLAISANSFCVIPGILCIMHGLDLLNNIKVYLIPPGKVVLLVYW